MLSASKLVSPSNASLRFGEVGLGGTVVIQPKPYKGYASEAEMKADYHKAMRGVDHLLAKNDNALTRRFIDEIVTRAPFYGAEAATKFSLLA